MMEIPILLLALVLAVVTVQVTNLKVAVISMGAFSMVLSVQYLLMSAPDVALAEAAIGSTLSTVLLLVALSRYKVFHVCLTEGDGPDSETELLLRLVETYCASAELDVHLTRSHAGLDHDLHAYRHDLVVHRTADRIELYGRERHYRIDELDRFLAEQAGGMVFAWKRVLH